MALDLREVVSLLHSGDWCSLSYITANVKKGTGGKVIDLQKCRIARRQPAPADHKSSNVPKLPLLEERAVVRSRDPNHNLHFTRNVELPNKMIRAIHPILIISINNQSVL